MGGEMRGHVEMLGLGQILMSTQNMCMCVGNLLCCVILKVVKQVVILYLKNKTFF